MESGLASVGRDTDAQTNPFEVQLSKYVDLSLPDDVVGIRALREIHARGVTRHLVMTRAKIALFQAFHLVWVSTGALVCDSCPRRPRQKWMTMLTSNAREALLLHFTEGFDFSAIGRILMIDPDEVHQYVEITIYAARSGDDQAGVLDDDPGGLIVPPVTADGRSYLSTGAARP